MRLRKSACILLALPMLLGLSSCGGKEDGSIKVIGESCNKVSKSVQVESKDDAILYMSEGDSDDMSGFQCLSDKIGFTADEIHEKVGDSGSARLEKNRYSIGISATKQNVMLVIKEKP